MSNVKAMQIEVLLSAQGSDICNPFAFTKTSHRDVDHASIFVTSVSLRHFCHFVCIFSS